MSERLYVGNQRLARIIEHQGASTIGSSYEAAAMAEELRERRAADLSAEDVEALEWHVGDTRREVTGTCTNPGCVSCVRHNRALAVLDKLLARAVAK